VTLRSSISTSGMDATACPDMSVARSVSVELGTSMTVDFNDRSIEIQDTAAAMLELAGTADTTAAMAGAARFRNPSNHYIFQQPFDCFWRSTRHIICFYTRMCLLCVALILHSTF